MLLNTLEANAMLTQLRPPLQHSSRSDWTPPRGCHRFALCRGRNQHVSTQARSRNHANTLSLTEQGATSAAVDIKKKPRRLSERTKNNSAGSGGRPASFLAYLPLCRTFKHRTLNKVLRSRVSGAPASWALPCCNISVSAVGNDGCHKALASAKVTCSTVGSDIGSLATSPLGSRNNSGPLSSLGQLVTSTSSVASSQKDAGAADPITLKTAPAKRQVCAGPLLHQSEGHFKCRGTPMLRSDMSWISALSPRVCLITAK